MDPCQKVENPASFSATLTVLIFAILFKGLQGQNLSYNLTVPDSVSVQRGLYVHIPCSFTYNQRDRSNPGKLYGYWFQKKDSHLHSFTHDSSRRFSGILVATNDKRQELQASVLNRFQLTGEPEEGDCSFSILNARSEDAGDYYFHIEDYSLRWSYKAGRPQVLVTGLRSQNLDYNLTVPASVSVQRGLCVHIPCSFTYNRRDRSNPGELYGYWFQKKYDYWHTFTHDSYRHIPGILVATNDKRQELRGSVLNRFQLTGKPEEGDCSFSILDARSEDAGDYYFRIEVNSLRWNYITQKPQVLVTELEEPQIWASSAVLSGKEALYVCSIPGPCVEIEARISWATSLTGYNMTGWRQQHINGSWTYGSNFTFTPSLNDQGRELTCRVWYPNIREQVTKSIRLQLSTTHNKILGSSVIILIIVCPTVKILFCILFFFSIIWVSNQRKAPLREKAMRMTSLDDLPASLPSPVEVSGISQMFKK
ncbi:sialic acid-binding Ig-like lectin 12 isoform X2 [Paroedura picta]|uniref:sialic acid-binding Ig-like lectin 12 isoform X2 n=1 Tax=Paroedura picta TaxID=143630 RepID=UPI0040560433